MAAETQQSLYAFPKRTLFGTLWEGLDPNALDEHGQTAFIRVVVNGDSDLNYPEMMAEFDGADINIQDNQGRTDLRWACAVDLSIMISLCLSVADCDLTHNANRTLLYRRIIEMEEPSPQHSLLRVLTLTSVPAALYKPVFLGEAVFDPIDDRNNRLVAALIDRRVDLTAQD